MSEGWGDIWNLAMATLGRESVEAQILIWLTIAFAFTVFVEGLRSTFFPSRIRVAHDGTVNSPQTKSVRVSAPQARLWRVIELSRREDGAPDIVAALSQAARNPRRRISPVRRLTASRPGIHRRPVLFLAPEPAFTMEMPPEPEFTELENGDLRLASSEA
ncbi:MAG: hypothetical protein HY243_00615 [Proteobacteria bacterium]|nr:hypothetical protein [Pseudomonadota bacterium]